MKIYLVGGAVRDEQLGLPINERDWCVVGAKPEDLLSKGYRRVGKDFPVFLMVPSKLVFVQSSPKYFHFLKNSLLVMMASHFKRPQMLVLMRILSGEI